MSYPLGALCLGNLYIHLDRLHDDEVEGSPYHAVESSVNVTLLQVWSGGSGSDNCKDVDVVSVLPECSVSTTTGSLGSEMVISDSSGKKLNPNNYFLNKIVLMQWIGWSFIA